MNIFKILSSNDGSINEPNISSFLSYLLSMDEDHGIQGVLLQELLSEFLKINNALEKITKNGKIGDLSKYDIKIIPEFSVFLDGTKKRRDIDILIEIYENNSENPLYAICLENKITDSSINKKDNQLEEEIIGLQNYYKENNSETKVYLLYLTPEPSNVSSESFNKLNYENKIHIYWDKDDHSIINKLLKIFKYEQKGLIDPITDQSSFLIKSFIAFIRTGFKSYYEEKSEKIEKRNYGKPVIDHLKDYSDKLEKNKIYKIKDIKEEFSKYVEKESGIQLHKSTKDAHIILSIVNEKNRIHYNVNRKDDDITNIFYYPNLENKKEISLYDRTENKSVNIEFKKIK